MSDSILGAGATPQNSLLFQAIETNNVRPFVVKRYGQFQEMANIIDVINKGQSNKNQSGARDLKMPYIPQLNVYAVIKTGGRTVISPTILKLEWTDSTNNNFITTNAVYGSNGTFGIVKEHGSGYIIVELQYSATGDSTFQTADFAAGTQVSEGANISAGVTDGKESRQYVPLEEYNTIGQQRYSLELTREDVSRKTVVMIDGQPYWQYANLPLNLQQWKNQMNIAQWNAPRVSVENKWQSGGIKWQIENQGGTRDTYSGEFNEDILINIGKNALEKGLGTTEYLVPCGFNVMAGLQKFIGSKYIQYAGTTNTIGGASVKGINIEMFKVMGIDFKFFNWSVLNNRAVNPEGDSLITGQLKSASTAVFLDTSPVQTVGYGTQPFISNYYYGQDGYYMATVEGMTDMMGRPAKNPTNTRNACSIQLEVNEMQQLNDPSRHQILEISQ